MEPRLQLPHCNPNSQVITEQRPFWALRSSVVRYVLNPSFKRMAIVIIAIDHHQDFVNVRHLRHRPKNPRQAL